MEELKEKKNDPRKLGRHTNTSQTKESIEVARESKDKLF